jgi:hypothetical protein
MTNETASVKLKSRPAVEALEVLAIERRRPAADTVG